MHLLSVAIITKNEEKNIRRCLESIQAIADEVIVVDSFSTDHTKSICAEFDTTFIEHPFEGHIQQKNFALLQCSHPLVLSLDADEALTEELVLSIQKIKLGSSPHDVYSMNRLTNYCGHWVKHCGWYPDTKTRLVRKDMAEWTGTNPHDRLESLGAVQPQLLSGDLLHYSYYTIEDHLKQIEYFSSIASHELYNKGRRTSIVEIVIKVIAQFVKSFIIKMGFLDGKTGFTISRLSAYATFRKYSMLRKLYAKGDS